MKKIIFSAAIMLLFLLVGTIAAASEYKLGYVNIQKAVIESIPGKEAMEKFGEVVKAMEEDIIKDKEQMEKLGEIINKQSMMLTEKVRREKEKDYLRKQRDFERKVKDSKTDLQIKEAELTNDILEKLIPIIRKYGKDNNYSIIFEKSERILLYASEALDLTDTIISTYNDQYQKKRK